MAASSSAPIGFDPLLHVNQFNITEILVDGGVICNSPALYAYFIAKEFNNEDQFRIVSIGTGDSKDVDLHQTENYA